MNSKNVLVLGAGVSGLTTALELIRAGHKVTIWSKEPIGLLPTTSANAYAMWVPVKIDGDARVERWANETLEALEKLSKDTNTGVTMRQIFVLRQTHEEPWYAGKVASFRHARDGEISKEYKDAHVLDKAPIIDPPVFLAWLRRQVIAAGGKISQHEVKQWSDCPSEFEVIVNCAGLGARELANDKTLFPERVQVVKVRANGFDKVVIDDDGPNKRACVVPHRDHIKLGGVFDGPQESLDVDDQATRDILERCSKMTGCRFTLSDVISASRALRPERSLTRVEQEKLSDGRQLVHNYGHDGMGFILSHGIAREIAGYLSDSSPASE
ncbi:MAG TPA: FAD-dependent oxidoreductase [Planktothrix sp.]|jgi:D-amino-acid oxidase